MEKQGGDSGAYARTLIIELEMKYFRTPLFLAPSLAWLFRVNE